MIRSARLDDADRIAAIYNYYIANTSITFEEQLVSREQIAQRIQDVLAVPLPWLVFEQAGQVSGYAYASKWKTRSAYRFSVEISVYLDHQAVKMGIGSKLYEALLSALTKLGIHAVMGGIALPNAESVALHEKFGLEKVAHLKEVGFKFGRWIDVGYWEKVL